MKMKKMAKALEELGLSDEQRAVLIKKVRDEAIEEGRVPGDVVRSAQIGLAFTVGALQNANERIEKLAGDLREVQKQRSVEITKINSSHRAELDRASKNGYDGALIEMRETLNEGKLGDRLGGLTGAVRELVFGTLQEYFRDMLNEDEDLD